MQRPAPICSLVCSSLICIRTYRDCFLARCAKKQFEATTPSYKHSKDILIVYASQTHSRVIYLLVFINEASCYMLCRIALRLS